LAFFEILIGNPGKNTYINQLLVAASLRKNCLHSKLGEVDCT